jgi:alkylation response protein AidB-like acyl-CoA dehydrogenase
VPGKSLSRNKARAPQVAAWLAANVPAELRGAGGPGREREAFAERLAWNRRLAAAGWTFLGWPAAYGGHDATLRQQVIFHEEYARSAAPRGSRWWGRNCSGRP